MEHYSAAIDILMLHAGKSFEEACAELGINPHQPNVTTDDTRHEHNDSF